MPLLRGAACRADPEVFAATSRTNSAKHRGRTAMQRIRPPPGRSRTRHKRRGRRSKGAGRQQHTILQRMADRPTERRRRRRAGRRRQESAKDKARRQDAELDAKFNLATTGEGCLATPPFHPGGLVAVFATQTSEAYNAFKGTPIEATPTTPLACGNKAVECLES